MPLKTAGRRIDDPTAKVKLKISEVGKVMDAICIYADDYRMAERAENLTRKYVFEPATQSGTPIATSNVVVIHFTYESKTSNEIDSFSNMAQLMTGFAPKENILTITSPRKLDSPLQVTSSAPTVLIQDEEGNRPTGSATVEGYVDWDGKFRFLTIVKSDNPYVAEAALANFSSLTFTPPTVEGRKTLSKIRMPFIAQ